MATPSVFASSMPPQAPPQQPCLLYTPACQTQHVLLQPGTPNGGAVVLSAPPAPGAVVQQGVYQPAVQAAPMVMHSHQGSGMVVTPPHMGPVAYVSDGHTSISYAGVPPAAQACSSPDSAYSSSDAGSCGSTYVAPHPLAGAPASFGGHHQAIGRPGYVVAPAAPPHAGSSAAFHGGPATGGPVLHITGPLQAQAGLHQHQQHPRPGPSSKRNKWGVDERLVCGTPWEVAWEVLRTLPAVQPVLDLERDTACLRNVYLHEAPSAAPASPGSEAGAGATTSAGGSSNDSASPQLSILDRTCELETVLEPEQLLSEEGLVRACRGLPARVRDDLIRAARLAVTRKEAGNGGGTGLLPFFWRVHTNLKWLMQQPATIKGQLSPGEIEFITNEQRSLSLRKTVAQRTRLSQMAVLLHGMLQVPAEDAALMAAAAAAAGVLRPAC